MELFHYKSAFFLLLPALSLLFDLFSVNHNVFGQGLQAECSMLLQLKQGFTHGEFDTWQSGTDCCFWKGVTCDESRRVVGLDLSNWNIGGKIDPSLFNLTSLRILNLSFNHFGGLSIPDFGWDKLANLSSLHLHYAGFSGKVPVGISHLTKLTSLDLSSNIGLYLSTNALFSQNMSNLRELNLDDVNLSAFKNEWCDALINFTPALETLSMNECSLFGAGCSSLSKLPFLSILSLEGNKLDSSILNSFVNLTKLSELQVDGNEFTGVFPKQIFQLKNLKYLYIANNSMLSGSLPDFSKDSSLEILYISGTNFSGSVPDTIGNLKFLKWLCLSGCQFSGRIPSSMENLSHLEVLDLSYNNFNGVVELEFIKNFKNLLSLDLSNSGFSLSSWDADGGSLSSLFSNMSELGLASCNLTKIPSFMKYQRDMLYLDLSNNKIHGEIPGWLWSITILNLSCNFFTHFAEPPFNLSLVDNIISIDLHSNMLEGHVLLPSITILFLDFSNNCFTSFIPSNISSNPNLNYLSLANNSLTGEIPQSICNLTQLQVLDLSSNRLVGSIPPCVFEEDMNLYMINLGGNQLHGAIPHHVSPKCMLQTINFNDNQLEGPLPRSLSNCQSLEILDLGNNNLKDIFPYWLGNIPSLRVLILRSNKLHGLVGPIDGNQKIKHTFHRLHILDISSNNFSGNLCADYFSNFLSMMVNREDTTYLRYYANLVTTMTKRLSDLDKLAIINKGQLMMLSNIWMMVKSIDFSNNYFEGKIPISIGQLVSLQVLNLSQNYFTDTIPPQLGNLSQLESLDLSMNSLFGKIPHELVSLYFLQYLNLSYNKLVGQIPIGGQFSTFSNTSFEGNEGLCWFPCNTTTPTQNYTATSDLNLDGTAPKDRSYMIVLGILFGVGFGVSMAIVLLIDVIYCDKGKKMRNMRPIHG